MVYYDRDAYWPIFVELWGGGLALLPGGGKDFWRLGEKSEKLDMKKHT